MSLVQTKQNVNVFVGFSFWTLCYRFPSPLFHRFPWTVFLTCSTICYRVTPPGTAWVAILHDNALLWKRFVTVVQSGWPLYLGFPLRLLFYLVSAREYLKWKTNLAAFLFTLRLWVKIPPEPRITKPHCVNKACTTPEPPAFLKCKS